MNLITSFLIQFQEEFLQRSNDNQYKVNKILNRIKKKRRIVFKFHKPQTVQTLGRFVFLKNKSIVGRKFALLPVLQQNLTDPKLNYKICGRLR